MRMRRLLQFLRPAYRLCNNVPPVGYYRNVVVGDDFVDLRVEGALPVELTTVKALDDARMPRLLAPGVGCHAPMTARRPARSPARWLISPSRAWRPNAGARPVNRTDPSACIGVHRLPSSAVNSCLSCRATSAQRGPRPQAIADSPSHGRRVPNRSESRCRGIGHLRHRSCGDVATCLRRFQGQSTEHESRQYQRLGALYQVAKGPTLQRHGQRRPAIHDFSVASKEVVDGRPPPAMT